MRFRDCFFSGQDEVRVIVWPVVPDEERSQPGVGMDEFTCRSGSSVLRSVVIRKRGNASFVG